MVASFKDATINDEFTSTDKSSDIAALDPKTLVLDFRDKFQRKPSFFKKKSSSIFRGVGVIGGARRAPVRLLALHHGPEYSEFANRKLRGVHGLRAFFVVSFFRSLRPTLVAPLIPAELTRNARHPPRPLSGMKHSAVLFVFHLLRHLLFCFDGRHGARDLGKKLYKPWREKTGQFP